MAAAFTAALTECAPGNQVTLAGTDLSGVTEVTLGGQLNIHDDGSPPTWDGTVVIPAQSSSTSVTFTVPDNVRSGQISATAGDTSIATTQLRIVSQYVQASEYAGGTEGVDTSQLAAGVLDQVLRDASAWADTFTAIGTRDDPGIRQLQTVELHKFRPKISGAPRIWPWRSLRLTSVDSLVFVTSNQLRTQFNVSQTSSSDVFFNNDLAYTEMLAYAFGNYVLLGAIETIGFSANVIELGYTSGYSYVNYPAAIRKATSIIATELLTYARIQAGGMGGFSSVKQGLTQKDRRDEAFAIPAPAKDLLRPYISRALR
jgi:hypothetical protein